MFNIAANTLNPDMSGAVNRGVEAGQRQKANKQAYEFGELEKESYLYEFGKKKKLDKAREDYFTTEQGSPEHNQATGRLMAGDPDFLQGMADQQRKAAEAKDKAAAANGKAFKELAPVMMQHTAALKQVPAEARTSYIQQNMQSVLESAPQTVRAQLQQGLEKTLQDGQVSDEELAHLEQAWSPFIEQKEETPTNWQFKTTQDGTIKAFDPSNPTATPVDTGESARDPKGGMLLRMDENGNPVFASGADGIAAAGEVSATKSTISNLQKDIANESVLLSDLNRISEKFDPGLLGYGANFNKWISGTKDKFNALDSDSDEAAFYQSKVDFDAEMDQFFNAYKKLITGSAAAVQEMADLRNSIANSKDGAIGFKSKLSQMQEKAQRGLRIKMALMRDGFNGSDKAFGKQHDALYSSGFDDDPEAQYEFLTTKMGLSETEAVAQMEGMGYE